MAGTNPVGTFGVTNVTSQTPQEWFAQSDGNSAVVERPADAFAPHPAASANMTVVLDAGFIDSVSPAGQETITEVASQTVTIAAAPISPNNRIDLISIDAGTGVYTYTQGTAAGSPSAPALPVGQRQICQVSVPNGTAVIGSGNITDLRSVWGPFGRGIPFAIAGGSSDALAGTFTPATPTLGNAFNGYIWRVRTGAANATTTPTFAPDGQGPWTIKKNGNVALAVGDIAGANQDLFLAYNYNSGSPFVELLNPALGASGVTTGSYTNADITVGTDGRITAASNGGGSGLTGATQNLVVSYASATTLTVTADEILVSTSLGGTLTTIASLNVTLNIATVGVNGMDTGSPPTSGDLSLYAIAGSGKTPGVLACLGSTSNGTIYSGSNMPSGYTQSALIGSYKTNSSAQFNNLFQRDRTVLIPSVTVISGGAPTSYTAASLSGYIPANTVEISGTVQTLDNSMNIASDSSGLGTLELGINGGSAAAADYFSIILKTSQTIYYKVNGPNGTSVRLSSYQF